MFRKPPKFERAIEPEIEVMYRVARRMTDSREDAEDLVGQTMVAAFQGWHTFDGRFLRSWLLTIMRRERSRLFGGKPRIEEEIEEIADFPDEQSLWSSLAARFEAQAILDALENLPQTYRLPIAICDIEQMSYEDAAKILDVPIGTVRSRLNRGRNQLKQKLMHWKTEEPCR
jgi:RNA polymerase sigma-70 factor (ECF subfamily)